MPGPGLPGLGRHIARHGLQGRGGTGGGTAAAQGGQGVGPQAGGAGGTRPARRRAADGSPYPQAAIRQRERKEGVPSGHTLLLLSKADRLTVGQVLCYPPPPLLKATFFLHFCDRGESIQGLRPLYPGEVIF